MSSLSGGSEMGLCIMRRFRDKFIRGGSEMSSVS